MDLYVIFAQRKCDYEGQYALEALAVADEYTMDENPDYILEKLQEYKKSDEFEEVKIVIVQIPDAKLYSLFRTPSIDGDLREFK